MKYIKWKKIQSCNQVWVRKVCGCNFLKTNVKWSRYNTLIKRKDVVDSSVHQPVTSSISILFIFWNFFPAILEIYYGIGQKNDLCKGFSSRWSSVEFHVNWFFIFLIWNKVLEISDNLRLFVQRNWCSNCDIVFRQEFIVIIREKHLTQIAQLLQRLIRVWSYYR